jgi:uncharacterized protein YodC (DUF2158 family)
MENTFKPGDTVTTTAGIRHSPLMVVKYLDNAYCICIWYNLTTSRFEEYKFPAETLIKS